MRWRLPRLRLRISNCSLLLICLPRMDERLSRPGWLTYSGRFTHISGHPSAAGRAQDRESSSPVKDRRSTNCATQPTAVTDTDNIHATAAVTLRYISFSCSSLSMSTHVYLRKPIHCRRRRRRRWSQRQLVEGRRRRGGAWQPGPCRPPQATRRSPGPPATRPHAASVPPRTAARTAPRSEQSCDHTCIVTPRHYHNLTASL